MYFKNRPPPEKPIKIGIIYSGSNSENHPNPLVASAQLALNEINQKGGLLGRLLELEIVQSESADFAQQVERILSHDSISALFGCLNTQCLSLVKPIVEKHKSLLFFPANYMGMEQSPNVIYLGSTPNQQISLGARWAFDHLGSKTFLIGVKQMKSIVEHQIMRDLAKVSEDSIVGERLLSLDETKLEGELARAVNEIKLLKPQFVFSTLPGKMIQLLSQELTKVNLHDLPIITSEFAGEDASDIIKLGIKNLYTLDSYDEGLQTESNQRFVTSINQMLHHKTIVNGNMERVYTAIYLWLETVKQKKSIDPIQVNTETLLRQSYPGPSGVTAIDAVTRHTWRTAMVLKLNESGQFNVVESSAFPLKPSPWPVYRTRDEWSELIQLKQTELEEKK